MAAIAIAHSGQVATITLHLPEGRFDQAALEELTGAARQVADQPDRVWAVVVTGASGFGLGWSQSLLTAQLQDRSLEPGAAFDAVAAIPQPVVAALSGRVGSAGLELALACDIRIASEEARFQMPETELGMVPQGGATQRLPRAIGRAHALRLLLTGESIGSVEARRIGLVSEVVREEALLPGALEIARTIASRGPIATRLAKEAVMRGSELSLAQGLAAELDLTVILQTTRDRAEGVQAFIEKRPPRFTNQ